MKKTISNNHPLFCVNFRRKDNLPVNFPILYSTLVFLFFSTFSFSSPQKDTLFFGSDKYFPPYEYLNKKGQAEGYNIDIIRELAREMNVEIIIKLGDWVKIRKELEVDGTIDFSDMFYSEARDSVVDYAFPHAIVFNKVYLHKSSPPILETSELIGKKVAVHRGSVLEEYLRAKFPDINLIPQTTESDALKMVSEKLCDAAIVTNVSGNELLKIENVIGYGNMILPSEYCFVVKKGNSRLLKKINLALANMFANGTIEKLRKKWFDDRIFGISQNHIKLGIIILLISLVLSYLLSFSLTRRIKKRNNQLLSSDKRWKFALEGAGDGIWDWNIKTNEVYLSNQCKKMLGYSEEEIENSIEEWDKRVHPNDKEKVKFNLNNHLTGKTPYYICEHRVLCKDGSYKWILHRGKVMEWLEKGKPLRIIGTQTDISEQIRTQDALKESGNRLKVILENTPLAIWDWDIKTDKWFATPKYYTMLGYEVESDSPDRMVWLNRIHPDDRDKVSSKIENVLNLTDEQYSYDARILHADGSYRWQSVIGNVVKYDNEGKVARMLGVRIDISERKKSEELLKESKKRFKQIMKSVNLASIIIESDGTISYCNDFFLETTGYQKNEVIGKNWFDTFIPSQTIQHIKNVFSDAISNNKVVPFMENEIKTKKGDLKTIAWNNVVLRNLNNNIIGVAGLGEDISLRKKAEKEILDSEYKFRTIFEESTDGIMLLDSGSNPLEVNKRICEILGYNREELLLKNAVSLIHPDDLPGKNHDEASQQLMEGKTIYSNYRLQKKDGQYVYTELSTKMLEGNKFLNIIKDITQQKFAADALIESEKRYRNLLETAPVGIFVISDNKVQYSNSSGLKILNAKSFEQVAGMQITKIIHPEYLKSTQNRLARLLAGENGLYPVQLKYLRLDGTIIDVEVVASNVLFQGKPSIMIIVTDITERKQIELKIKENEKKYRQIFDSVGDCIFTINPEGVLISINPVFEKLTGWPTKEWINKPFMNLIHPDDLPKALNAFEKILINEEVEAYELRIRTKSGEYKIGEFSPTPLISEGKIVGSMGIARDITDRKLADEELKNVLQREQFLANIIRNASVAVSIGFPSGKLGMCNKAFQNLVGYSEQELKEIQWNTTLTPPEWLQQEYAQLDIISQTKKSLLYEKEYIHKDGHIIPVELVVNPFFDEKGDLIHFFVFVTDLTERKQAEEEIKKLNEELEQKVEVRTEELKTKIAQIERMNKLFVGRELRMKELKVQMKLLEEKLKGNYN